MLQKIIQIGNSTGVIIPKSLLDAMELSAGQEIEIQQDKESKTLIIHKKGANVHASSITTHFLKILDKVNQEYGAALKELANK